MDNSELARLEWPRTDSPAELYLELLKRVLSGILRPQRYTAAKLPGDLVQSEGFQQVRDRLREHGLEITQEKIPDLAARVGGIEWIPDGETMVGLLRLDNVHQCIQSVLDDNIPGDFIETGVWRGGTCIFMRGCLKAYQATGRRVWVADSFQGLPPPDENKYPADSGDVHHTYEQLIVPKSEVEANFRKYGLMDDNVRFLEGWFKNTLPGADIEKLAVMRLDGDMYESTMDAISTLYPRLSVGGFAIIDDYLWHKPCAQAVEDYRSRHGITEPVRKIDAAGVYWRKTS